MSPPDPDHRPTTDWDRYYRHPYKTAAITRRHTTSVLIKLIERHADTTANLSIVELGGANSCFYQKLEERFSPRRYAIIDNNAPGLSLLRERIGENPSVALHNEDVLDLTSAPEGDLCFSVGLIEHFSPEDTKRAIVSHFRVLRKGGLLVLGFPTPTFLYRITRKVSELLGLWIFHDERPLGMEEVLKEVREHGCVLEKKIIWPIFLTQGVIVARKS